MSHDTIPGWVEMLCFVVPVNDEEPSVQELYRRIEREVEKAAPFEVIFIDDGSEDASWERSICVDTGAPSVRPRNR